MCSRELPRFDFTIPCYDIFIVDGPFPTLRMLRSDRLLYGGGSDVDCLEMLQSTTISNALRFSEYTITLFRNHFKNKHTFINAK